jgi:low temperature requirement protein LtrA
MLVRPIRLHTLEKDPERRVTWLELFFDLVFVAAVSQAERRSARTTRSTACSVSRCSC